MQNETNIEDVFKNGFENFEAPVDPSVWVAVQAGIGAQVATSLVAAKAAAGWFKTMVIASTTLAGGVALGYMFFGTPEDSSTKSPRTVASVTVNGSRPEGEKSAGELTQPVKMVEFKIPVQDQSTGKEEMVTIQVPQPAFLNSSVYKNDFSEEERRRWEKYYEEKIKNEENKVSGLSENAYPVNEPENTNAARVETIDRNEPVAFINVSKTSGIAPLTVTFENYSKENSYFWDFGDGSQSAESDPGHTFREPGVYTVKLTVKNENGKTAVANTEIVVFEPSQIELVPNVFSPNQDGINDTYKVLVKNMKTFSMRIYTRDGNTLLYQSVNPEEGWNGQDPAGNQMPEGIYLVYIEAVGTDHAVYKKGISFTLTLK